MNEVQRYYAAAERLDEARINGSEPRIHRLTAWVDKLAEEASEALEEETRKRRAAVNEFVNSIREAFKPAA